ncbi:hypothetical protein [Floridanema evergladense]|uniref:TerB-C domain-containing protein n=1 Tax=Floridaenema evergladense BLCC-F167 TaxID=3153639 RepID=A0ABV4WP89_9CYAN
MTFQTAKIQALIAEIDAVLSKDSKSRFGWLVGDGNPDRQMLERVRQQLQKWQEQLIIIQATGEETQAAEITSYQILFGQADREGDRVILSESLQTEIALLQQQRQLLLNEVQQLQRQRQALINPDVLVAQQQIFTEFSQALIERLQETVKQQLAETLEKIPAVQLPEAEVETSLKQETVSAKLEFIGLETMAINPQLELLAAAIEPLPYAGVELTGLISEKLENAKDSITLPSKQNDTISALTDLIQEANLTTALPEDLLTNELPDTKAKVDLWLGDNIVEQLKEDLSDLEEVEPLNVQPLEDLKETITNATDSIELDLAAAVEQEQEKINAAIPEHILAEFEDLFGDSNSSSVAASNIESKPEELPEIGTKQEPVEPEKKN